MLLVLLFCNKYYPTNVISPSVLKQILPKNAVKGNVQKNEKYSIIDGFCLTHTYIPYFPSFFVFYRTQVSLVRSMGPVLSHYVCMYETLLKSKLADGDIKSILSDTAKRSIQGNVAMHVTHPVNLVIKF